MSDHEMVTTTVVVAVLCAEAGLPVQPPVRSCEPHRVGRWAHEACRTLLGLPGGAYLDPRRIVVALRALALRPATRAAFLTLAALGAPRDSLLELTDDLR